VAKETWHHVPMKTPSLIAGLALLLSACGANVDLPTAGAVTACDGALGGTPSVLATGLGAGKLRVAGDSLVYVESELGRVLRIDRCSGATELLAQLDSVQSSAVRGDRVYVVGTSNGAPGLYRVPVAGGALELVTDIPFGPILAHDSGIYTLKKAGPDTEDVNILSLDEASGELSILHVIKLFAPGSSVFPIGVTDAGLYVVESYDCGCNPTLSRATFDGTSYTKVPGTEGAFSLAAVGGSLFVAADIDSVGFGSVLLDVVRLPLEGGEPEILFAADEAHTYDVRVIAANERAVCWAGYQAAPRCLGLASGSQIRVLGGEGERKGSEPLVMTDDAVYWLRIEPGGAGFELMGAVP
jgi:hypothetical protein